jgi:membrane protein YqaA with SNARE-associated domain
MAESSHPETGGEADPQAQRAARPALRLGDWFVPFGALLAVLGGVYLASGRAGTAAGVTGYFAYMSLACTFLPLPTAWIVLWASSPTDGLGLAPLAAATLGAVGTGIANMHDYYLVTWLARLRPAQRIRRTGLYRRLAAWFRRAPFGTLAAASFLPIPVDFVRLLAIGEGYSRWKFALGSVVGRWPRYLMLAYLAERFSLGWEWIVGIGGAAAALGLARAAAALASRWQERRAARRAAVGRAEP